MAIGGIKFVGSLCSDQGVRYRIKIYDSDLGVDLNTPFKLGDYGFKLTYKGKGSERYEAIHPSEVTFDFMVETSLQKQWVLDLYAVNQGRIKILIERSINDGVSYSRWWCGVMLNDISTLPDISNVVPYKIKAVDGLSLLKKIDFDRDIYNGSVGSPTTLYTHYNILANMLINYCDISEFYTTGETWLYTIVNWYESSMATPASNVDPLLKSASYPKAFFDIKYDDNGAELETKPISAYDVLENLCKCWGARLFYDEGSFKFVQIEAYNNRAIATSCWYRRYQKGTSSGDLLGSGHISIMTNLSEALNPVTSSSTGLILLSGSTNSYMPPLRKVRAEYGKWTDSGLYSADETVNSLAGIFSANTYFQANKVNLGYVEALSGSAINVDQKYMSRWVANLDGTNDYALGDFCNILIYLEIDNGVTQWSYSGGNGGSWMNNQTSATQIFLTDAIPAAFQLTTSWDGPTVVNFNTAELPISGDLYFSWAPLMDNTIGGIFFTGSKNYQARLMPHQAPPNTSKISYTLNNNADIAKVFVSEDPTSTANEVYDFGVIRLGDGPTTSAPSWGRIRVDDGAAWTPGKEDQWQAFETGTVGNITQILAEQCFSGQRTFLHLDNLKFVNKSSTLSNNGNTFFTSINYDPGGTTGIRYIPTGMTYTALTDTIEGEYFEMGFDSTGITNSEVTITEYTGGYELTESF